MKKPGEEKNTISEDWFNKILPTLNIEKVKYFENICDLKNKLL